ncbi:alpha/beta hydrolase [Oceanicoccus sp. KOV_DT_Chl]|uniref:alpha/beta hydrolase n=1 Tax=Oceanicoccus sp. KOV_DT_Chl TaxID=1904639 RepID=UPI000C7D7F71|nr:alpha/beta hydrolase [Oceanicoccus sp. KOV_DT_Chl]
MNLDALAKQLKPFDPSIDPATSDAELAYFRFYGINFEENFSQVKHHFGYFNSGRFTIVAHYFALPLATDTCFIVHGYYDHAGLYGNLIEYCLKRNMAVVIFDLPGHGLSTGERASIASFADYQTVFTDLLQLVDGKVPRHWYAMGQSTGGAILMDYLLSGGESVFSKTVLLAPLVRPHQWHLSLLSHKIVSCFVDKIKRRFAINSDDKKFLMFIKNKDPLQCKELPLQWVSALKQWLLYFLQLPPAVSPVLIVQGEQDDTVDWRYNLAVIRKKFSTAKFFYIKQGRHHLVNEGKKIRAPMFSAIDMFFDVYKSGS